MEVCRICTRRRCRSGVKGFGVTSRIDERSLASEYELDFQTCLMKMESDKDKKLGLLNDAMSYKERLGHFEMPLAVDSSYSMNLVAWWNSFGLRTRDLSVIAKRILSLCVKVSSCERNWSTFSLAIASKKKIYIVLELATGGELFDTITSRQKMKEDDARHYFQQLVTAVDFCHSRGIYHRDLKPENLLLDSNGVLKVTDFGLSALPHQLQVDGLLHTRCGSPNYVAPEVINNARRGYDGAKSDLWSCGVILFVLLAGYLPFDDTNMFMLFKKIGQADFTCPGWITKSAQKLIKRILNPNPDTRITMVELFKNSWFRKGYKSPIFEETPLDVVRDIFDESLMDEKPPMMNAFHIIAGFGCFDLRKLFENLLDCVEKETRFISKLPPEEVVSMIKMAVKPLGFRVVKNKKYKMKLLGGKVLRKGQLAITTEIYELFPSLSLVEVFKSKGDTVEFHKFYQDFMVSLKDAVWTLEQENNHDTSQTFNCSSIYE